MICKQREMSFRPSIKVQIASGFAATVAAIPLAYFLRDYSAMVFVILIRALSETIASHCVSEKKYSLGFYRNAFKEAWSFGWPLLLNGALLFVVIQGDRFLIGTASTLFPGSHYTMKDLGIYAVAAGFALIPAALIGKVAISVLVPFLSEAQFTPEEFVERYRGGLAGAGLITLSMAVAFFMFGELAITTVYGSQYAVVRGIIGWLGLAQAFRVLRMVPTAALISVGDTRGVFINNIIRTGAFVFTFLVVAYGVSLLHIAVSVAFGELIAVLACQRRVRRSTAARCNELLWFTGLTTIAAAIGFGFDSKIFSPGFSFGRVLLMTSLIGIGTAIVGWNQRLLARYVISRGVISIASFRRRILERA